MSVISSDGGRMHRLNDAAEIVIQDYMLAQPPIAVAVRNCVFKYSKPHTFFETLNWIIYRIWNAVKSIFDQSDWQKTRGMIYDHILAFASSIPTNFQTKEVRTLYEETMKKMLSRIAENLLSVCLLANNSWCKISREEVRKRLRDHSIPAQFKTMSSHILSALDKVRSQRQEKDLLAN